MSFFSLFLIGFELFVGTLEHLTRHTAFTRCSSGLADRRRPCVRFSFGTFGRARRLGLRHRVGRGAEVRIEHRTPWTVHIIKDNFCSYARASKAGAAHYRHFRPCLCLSDPCGFCFYARKRNDLLPIAILAHSQYTAKMKGGRDSERLRETLNTFL